MAKNLMPEVAKLLGVKIGEQFRLHNVERDVTLENLYYLNEENGLMCIQYDDGRTLYSPYVINSILTGNYEIIKLPWEPKNGEPYFFPQLYSKRVDCTTWVGSAGDYALKALGIVYRTREEASEHFAEDYEKLTGQRLKND